MRPTPKRLTVLAAILVITGACGTTVPGAEDAHRRGMQGGNLAVGGSDDTADGSAFGSDELGDPSGVDEFGGDGLDVGPGGSGGGGTSAGTSPGSPTTAGRTPTGGGASGGGGAPASGASARGVTAKEISVGIVYDESAGANNAAFGFAGIGQVDQRRSWEALIADVNGRGGVAGRRLKPVWFSFDSTDPSMTTDALYQQICSSFTKDNAVFGAFLTGNETLKSCLSKAGVVQIGAGGSPPADTQELAKYPLVVQLAATLDRVARFAVPRLHAMGFYAEGKEIPGFKLGVVRYDDPPYQRASGVLSNTLSDHGYPVSDEVAIRKAQNTSELSDEFNAIRAAVLRFKSANISHVQFIGDTSAFLPLTFMQNAEKQVYRPRYGLVSSDGGQALATLLGGDAQPQLSKSLLVGWFPLFDVRAQDYSGDKTTPAFRRCKEILAESGERFGEGDPTRNKEAIAAIYCDTINYFKNAVDTGGTTVTPQSWLRGVSQIRNMDSATTFILTTTEKRHDAVGGAKDDRWFDDCSCFKYTSDIHPV